MPPMYPMDVTPVPSRATEKRKGQYEATEILNRPSAGSPTNFVALRDQVPVFARLDAEECAPIRLMVTHTVADGPSVAYQVENDPIQHISDARMRLIERLEGGGVAEVSAKLEILTQRMRRFTPPVTADCTNGITTATIDTLEEVAR